MKNGMRRIISIILAATISISCIGIASAKRNDSNNVPDIFERYEDIYNNGYRAFSTQKFVDFIGKINDFFESVLGIRLVDTNKIQITLTGAMYDVFNSFYDSSDGMLDVIEVLNLIPLSNTPVKAFYELTKIDRNDVVAKLKEVQEDLASQGMGAEADVVFFFRAFFQMFDEVVLTAYPTSNEGVYEIICKLMYIDGTVEEMYTGYVYDANKGLMYGKGGHGFLGYELSSKDNVIYTAVDCWQRNLGFSVIYDLIAYTLILCNYTTERIDFNYQGKEWRIQLWKGTYLMSTGGEIGIYTRPEGSKGTFYNCGSNEDMMPISMSIYHGDELFFERDTKLTWWTNGFQLRDKLYLPTSLTMNGSIEFFDEEMANHFVNSLKKNKNITFERNGNVVEFIW